MLRVQSRGDPSGAGEAAAAGGASNTGLRGFEGPPAVSFMGVRWPGPAVTGPQMSRVGETEEQGGGVEPGAAACGDRPVPGGAQAASHEATSTVPAVMETGMKGAQAWA